MRHRLRLATLLLTAFACLTFSPVPAEAQADKTYEIVVRAYCEPGTFCGYPSENALEQHFEREILRINTTWVPNRISFRLGEVILTEESTYSQIEFSSDVDDPNTTLGGQIKALRDIAAQDPDVVTLFALPKLNTCWSIVAGHNTPKYPSEIHGVFCNAAGDFSVLSHELGHHFCLPHPFSFQDPADGFSTHDGDGLADTPPDPGVFEGNSSLAGADADASGNPVNGHEWCAFDQFWDVDPGSFMPRYCEPDCKKRDAGLTSSISDRPNTALAMSYYKHACIGPYVVDGERVPAFSPDSVAAVRSCVQDVPARAALPDVCGADVDSDNDGICDGDDVCPEAQSLDQTDTDGDDIGDACDLCPMDPAPTNDVDQDGIGDACDTDIDNDGCLNEDDDDPYVAVRIAGTYRHVNCDQSTSVRYEFAGQDSDGDGVLDCELSETDDDDDGISDDEDACPVVPGADPVTCERPGELCPLLEELASDCIAGCGRDYILRLLAVMDPDQYVTFDEFAVVNDVVYVPRQPGLANSETARVFRGEGILDTGSTLRLEIWSRDTQTGVATLAEFDADRVTFGDIQTGTSMAIALEGAEAVSLSGTWATSVKSGQFQFDSDGDQVPDQADNCLHSANTMQRDFDSDGYGDACDADFDNDGIVAVPDLDLLRDCDGADLDPRAYFGEPWLTTIEPDVAETQILARASYCRFADLDGDLTVDDDDVDIAEALLGLPPGPAGSREYDDTQPGDDTGMDAGSDVGPADTGTDADTSDTGSGDGGSGADDDGCGCNSTGGQAGGAVLLLLVGLLAIRRRRNG